MGPLAILVLLGLLSIASVLFYTWLAHQIPPLDSLGARRYFGWPDILLCLVISTLFLWIAFLTLGKTQFVTFKVLLDGVANSIMIVMVLIAFLLFRRINPLVAFGLRWSTWQRDLPIVALSFLAVLPVVYFSLNISNLVSGPDVSMQGVVRFLRENTDVASRSLLIFSAVILAPISEELVFRGYLYGVFRDYLGRLPALIIVAVLFAAVHAHLPSFASLFLLATALTLVYERTSSLWAPMLMHATFNTLTVLSSIFFPDLFP